MFASTWFRWARHHPICYWVVLMSLVLIGLPGCNTFAQTTPLAFQTLAQGEFLSGTDGKTRMKIAATPQEGNNLTDNLRTGGAPELTLERLHQLDYQSAFAVLVVRQSVGSSGFQITVQEIIRQGNQVTIKVHLDNPDPNSVQLQAFFAPYHLVTISKSGTWGQPIHFIMMADNNIIAETTQLIP